MSNKAEVAVVLELQKMYGEEIIQRVWQWRYSNRCAEDLCRSIRRENTDGRCIGGVK